MKKLVLALLFVPSIVAADYYPTYGCFIEPYQSNCSPRLVECQADYDRNLAYFGTTVGSLCNDYAYCVNRYTASVNVVKKNTSLITRLRRACGTKCRKIK